MLPLCLCVWWGAIGMCIHYPRKAALSSPQGWNLLAPEKSNLFKTHKYKATNYIIGLWKQNGQIILLRFKYIKTWGPVATPKYAQVGGAWQLLARV